VTIGNSVTIGSLPNISGTVTVSNLPATQAVTFGQSTITGSVSILNLPATQTVTFTTAPVTFGTSVITGSASILNFPATQTVTFTQASVTFGTAVVTGSTSILNFPASQAVTFTNASVTFGTAVITGSASILNFPATQTVTFTQIATHGVTIANTSVTVNGTFYQATQPVSLTALPALVAGTAQIGSVTASISNSVTIGSLPAISGTVTVGNSVTIGSLPAISGTVTANAGSNFSDEIAEGILAFQDNEGGFGIGSLPAISGTVTASALKLQTGDNVFNYLSGEEIQEYSSGNPVVAVYASLPNALPTGTNRIGVVTIGAGTVTIGAGTSQIGSVTASISGTVPVSISSVTVGNSVTIGNFPATQAVTFGQAIVSASNITGLNNSVGTDGGTPAATNFVKIGGHQDGSNSVEHIVHVSAGGSMKVDASDSTVTFGTIGGTVTVGNTVTIAGTVTANPTGTQTIAGTVTANGGDFASQPLGAYPSKALRIGFADDEAYNAVGLSSGGKPLPITLYDNQENVLGGTSNGMIPLAISGTVTVGNSVTIGSLPSLVAGTAQIGSVTASISNSVTIGSLPAISGTVTANSSNGSLTTRFGSVTTANTAFETSAVTNANRKYLLIQNVTTASNVITVGIGFTPTTTQGIQLFAGAGLTFEGSYIPTGAVNLLSSVTASCYTILEG
jgi:hypothetical protein